jgi:hypothetical protein
MLSFVPYSTRVIADLCAAKRIIRVAERDARAGVCPQAVLGSVKEALERLARVERELLAR